MQPPRLETPFVRCKKTDFCVAEKNTRRRREHNRISRRVRQCYQSRIQVQRRGGHCCVHDSVILHDVRKTKNSSPRQQQKPSRAIIVLYIVYCYHFNTIWGNVKLSYPKSEMMRPTSSSNRIELNVRRTMHVRRTFTTLIDAPLVLRYNPRSL
jgi:hypothetical protein